MSIAEERLKRPGQSLVLVEEEHGHHVWFWFTTMTPDELERWWRELDTVMYYFFSAAPLAEKEIRKIKKGARANDIHFLENFDFRSLPGDVLAADFDEYDALQRTKTHYEARLHMDFDSVLVRPDGSYVFHAGCTGDNLYLPEDLRRRTKRELEDWELSGFY